MIIEGNLSTSVSYSLDIPTISIEFLLNLIKPNGKLVYEYNPLRNYRYLNSVTDYLGQQIEPNVITDLDTENFNFSLKHPVEIECLPSYDGSVNLILNDDYNSPKLINSRFSVRENNTYEIVDRIGSNDTNLYDDSQFDLDTSLYKRVNEIPNLEFLGLTYGGKMPVGNYNFYFKYCDADGNETDFISESGTVVCHIGNINDPKSMRGGLENENSHKIVQFLLSNVDSAYDYVTVYYTRSTSQANLQGTTKAFKILKKYKVKGNQCLLNIDGYEQTEEISSDVINLQYFVANTAKTLANCQNMLFLGNLESPSIDFEDFTDLSLRMLPYYQSENANSCIGELDQNYRDIGNAEEGFEYYNVKNIYNKVGYWNEEIYRLGIVYILNNDTLSPVFNIRGLNKIPKMGTSYNYTSVPLMDGKKRNYLSYDETTYMVNNSTGLDLENAKGVIRIDDKESKDLQVYSINIKIPKDVIDYIKSLKSVKGFFFVRLKRIPTILAQAFTMGHDTLSGIPLIKYNQEYYAESFIDKFAKLDGDYKARLFKVEDRLATNEVAICPEYELQLPYFNSIFTDTEFVYKEPNVRLKETGTLGLNKDIYEERHYYKCDYEGKGNNSWGLIDVLSINDSVSAKRNDINLYSALAGNPEEVNSFKFVGKEFKIDYESGKKNDYDNNIIRGAFGPYLGISRYKGDANRLINIYIPNYSISDMNKYFRIRYEDVSPYTAISDRYSLKKIDSDFNANLYRGDCFICNFTHRLNRNFLDIMAPNADTIVDENCWKDHYKPNTKLEDLNDINIGDLNAVRLGSWITIKVCSNINLSLRDVDMSYPDEFLLTGNHRTFYPLSEISTDGNYKVPESGVINTKISNTLSGRYNFTLAYAPYRKNKFSNRIAYSDIAVNDAFKNGFRVFLARNYVDYPTTYGSIVKLVELNGSLLCVFEHGLAIIPVNERVLSGSGTGGSVYVNSETVLPKTVRMISDSIGSLWADSVIKTDQAVYGVDTVAKKIWRLFGGLLEILSESRILRFLNENISLSERELTPIIGIRNVKTHYNAFKKDIMFTFYDNLYGFEEKAWNICFNEYSNTFLTFYSWIPSYSANIDNIFFSFDRLVSRDIAKLGITLANFNSEGVNENINSEGIVLEKVNFSGKNDETIIHIDKRPMPNTDNTGIKTITEFYLLRDNYGNYKKFNNGEYGIPIKSIKFTGDNINEKPVWLLNIEAQISIVDSENTNIKQYIKSWKEYTKINAGYYKSQVAITSNEVLENLKVYNKEKASLSTDFWRHGYSGIFDNTEPIKPCLWYGKQHPFEMEFIVKEDPDKHKIFDNLQIIGNNAKPDSFHYEIIGDCFDFKDDKPNMYIRLELTKDLFLYNGSNITYNTEVFLLNKNKSMNKKSTILPLFYFRLDKCDEVEDSYLPSEYNSIEDYYKGLENKGSKDYINLSGTEVVYYPIENEYRLWNHVKAVDITEPGGRLRGNMHYQEDKWRVLINPINIIQKNEKWNENRIPLVIHPDLLPKDLLNYLITDKDFPSNLKDLGYTVNDLYVASNWNNPNKRRSEIKLKDKFMKVKIRYTGEDLVILELIKTIYRIIK